MAKDVDLSSKEWRDIVFEGKNKEYGAYEMRKNSDSRHNKAMLVIVIVIALVFILTLTINQFVQSIARPEDTTEQELVELVSTDADKEDKEEEEQQKYEEKEVVKPEEIQNTQKVMDFNIVEDKLVKQEVKSQDQVKDDNTTIGQVEFKGGSDDISIDRTKTADIKFEAAEPKKEEPKKEEKKEDDHKVFDHVEQMPVFPGGDAALMSWIASHIKYPAIAQENNIQGRVTVRFVVTKTGSIGEAKVVRSADPALNAEAVRVVKALPKFTPGKQNGNPVAVWYTVPITFKLQGT